MTAKIPQNSREASPQHPIAHIKKNSDHHVVVPTTPNNEAEVKTTTNLTLLYGISLVPC